MSTSDLLAYDGTDWQLHCTYDAASSHEDESRGAGFGSEVAAYEGCAEERGVVNEEVLVELE